MLLHEKAAKPPIIAETNGNADAEVTLTLSTFPTIFYILGERGVRYPSLESLA